MNIPAMATSLIANLKISGKNLEIKIFSA